VIKSQIDVAIILSFDDVLETNDVLVAGQGLNGGNGNEERERRRRGEETWRYIISRNVR
jgi:allantoicase